MKHSSGTTKALYAVAIVLTALFAIAFFLFQMPTMLSTWVVVTINLISLTATISFAVISTRMRQRLGKDRLVRPSCTAIYVVSVVFITTYGYLYDVGEGVEEDSAEAVKWYLQAARQGWPFAQNNLARMYWDGEGVDRDAVEAAAWGILAGRRGIRNFLDAAEPLDEYASIRPKAEERAKELRSEIRVKSNKPSHTAESRAEARLSTSGER